MVPAASLGRLLAPAILQRCGGTPMIDWGSMDGIGTRDCLRRIRERRGVKWCEELEWGKPLFIELRRCYGACSGCPWRWLSGLRRGKAGDGVASSGGPCARHGAAGGGQERAGDVVVLAVPGRRASTVTAATTHARANGDV
ncbi:hypothetical protein QYE76_020207 [Lolium multiflorum]|uniref:Uncharacterized protein n=1 Tax=Lolium multiflorum TaxID=4521 RepID=A0AAD8VRN4_LOLMU|nr:hypothetical protein QYE76_020207 [Lolium multiflorum]